MQNNLQKFFLNESLKDLFTINDFLRWTYSKLKESNIWYGHGTNNAWDETLYLILATLGITFNMPKNLYNSRLTNNEKNMIVKLIKKRVINRIPVAYLVNKAWFCNFEFYVDQRVLIPRSPIAELINQKFSSLINYKPKFILDLCTGSGCIAVACSYMFPDARIDAVDISKDALKVAKKNIYMHRLHNKIKLINSNLFDKLNLKYDIIITNPPYVSLDDIKILPKEYSYEPTIGLNAGKDSLKIVKKIIFNANNFLTNKGILICEVGNNIKYLLKKYCNIPFQLINLKNGGEGVFVLKKSQLDYYKKYFF